VVVVAALAVISGALTLTSRSSVGEAEAASASATSRMTDFEFVPASYSVEGGSRVLVRNDDPFLHTFTVDELGIDEVVTPGSEKLIAIPSRPGSYFLYCQPHTGDKEDPGEDDMVGTLVVT
jgi:plastocyanin